MNGVSIFQKSPAISDECSKLPTDFKKHTNLSIGLGIIGEFPSHIIGIIYYNIFLMIL